jgi:phage/plasmid-like protein (TIGR03299 family)
MAIFNSVGTDIQDCSFETALEKADLNWTVSKRPIFVLSENDQDWHGTSKFFAMTRDDKDHILGIVGPDYVPVQNRELAYLCERLHGKHVKIETAGSLYDGQRVWIQMRGDAFGVGPKHDENIPMTLFTNGHDGQWPLSSLPTSYRVICQNTLNMALRSGKKNNMIISMKHVGDMQSRLEQMIIAIEQWKDRTEAFKEKAEILARKEINSEFIQNFWTNIYADMFGTIHENPMNEDQQQDNKDAMGTMIKWSNTFDSEVKHSGANLWTAMNSVTYWLDHQQIYRGSKKSENKFNDTLFGNGAKEKVNVMNYALELV